MGVTMTGLGLAGCMVDAQGAGVICDKLHIAFLLDGIYRCFLR